MKNAKLSLILDKNPIIAAVKNGEELKKSLESQSRLVFVLFGSIISIGEIVEIIKKAGKLAIVHIDLVEGLAPKEVGIDFIAKNTKADGIISTRPSLIKYAKANYNLFTIQRFFILDSIALANFEKQLPLDSADAIEILPGVMPKIIQRIVQLTAKPIIAGGLMSDREDIEGALRAGAYAISSTNAKVWFMDS